MQTVALLAEGVDRNSRWTLSGAQPEASPSSRRAWIEIHTGILPFSTGIRRPPRGGRG